MRRPLAAAAVVLAIAASATACDDNTKPADDKGAGSQAPSNPAQGAGGTAQDQGKGGQSGALGVKKTIKGTKSGEQLDVTLKNWVDPAKSDNKYTPPKPGKKYVAAQFEIVNTGTAPYADSPTNSSRVIDAQNERYNASVLSSIAEGPSLAADLKLATGQKTEGWVVFSVPEKTTVASVEFSMDSGLSKDAAQWTLKK
ncbi:DUF4352 domain-containing protein [Streptomyces sp. NPDC002536]